MPEIAIPTPHIADRSRPARPGPLLRSILRDSTAAEHARLDARLGALDLCTIDGYRRFLEINAAALLPLEQSLVLAGVRDVLPDWDDRARSEAILGDLARLGGSPRPLDAPVLTDRFAVLGTLYVLEGSRLGAAYLLRAVRQCSDPVISGNTAFLGHGAGRPFWPGFLAMLESHAGDLADEAAIVAPARRAFALFEHAAALS
jgi:heme oxygenase (biliverdin-IX-beta and delta-forming)